MPWFLIALFAVVAVIGLIALMPKPDIENARASKLGDFQFPRAQEGDPIPIIYGRVKLKSPNTLWYGDFGTARVTEKVKTGLFSSKRITTGYRYYIGMALGLCLGGDDTLRLRRIWAGKTLIWGYDEATDSVVHDRSGLSGYIDKLPPATWPSGRLLEYPVSPLITLMRVEDDDTEQRAGIAMSDIAGFNGIPEGEGYGFTIKAGSIFGGDKKGGGIAGECVFYSGSNNQKVDGYLAAHTDGADTTRMPKMCYLVMKHLYVGTSTNISAFSFELERYSNRLQIPDGKHKIGVDMNPVEVLFDIMTNKFARRGMSASKINTAAWREAAATVFDEGIGMSLKIEQANQAKEVVSEILRQIDGIMYQDPSTGLIELKLIRQDYDPVAIPSFGIEEVEDVTDFTKTMWDATVNQARVKYVDREQGYTSRPVIEQDMANIAFQQQVRSTEVEFPGVYSKDLAQELARRELASLSVPMFKCDVLVNRKATLLRPGDVFKLTWPALNLRDAIMRVTTYNLGTLTDGRISFTAVQDKFASLTTAFQPPQDSGWVPVSNAAQSVANPRLWTAPKFFVDQLEVSNASLAYLFAFAEGANGAQVSYDVWVGNGTDDGEDTLALDDTGFTEVGITAAVMPANKDTIAALSVSSVELGFPLATPEQIREGKNLALIGDEVVAFDSCTTTEMVNVYRGLLGTVAAEHAAGSRIHFLADQEMLSNSGYTPSVEITAEFLSETATHAQDVGEGITLTYTPTATAAADAVAQNVEVTNNDGGTIPAGINTISWEIIGRSDDKVILPGDADPLPPAGTQTNLTITNGGSEILNVMLNNGVLSYDYDFAQNQTVTVSATPVSGGIAGLAASVTLNVAASADKPVIPPGVPDPVLHYSPRDVEVDVDGRVTKILNVGAAAGPYDATPNITSPVAGMALVQSHAGWGDKDVFVLETTSNGGYELVDEYFQGARTIIGITTYGDGTTATFSTYDGFTGGTLEITGAAGSANLYSYGRPYYVNGVLTDAALPLTKGTIATTHPSSGGGSLSRLFRDDFSSARNWMGIVGDIMVFDVELTPAQIQAVSNNMIAYYS